MRIRTHGNRLYGYINSVKAKCHPDRPHEAFGLCGSCYTLKNQMKTRALDPAAWKLSRCKIMQKCMLKKAGWTPESVEDAKRKQNNRCAICRVVMKAPQADHEHVVPPNPRGLLCRSCNIGLGHFKDSPKLLKEAAKYVEKYRK